MRFFIAVSIPPSHSLARDPAMIVSNNLPQQPSTRMVCRLFELPLMAKKIPPWRDFGSSSDG
jgi:hypothetical protein